MIMGSKKIEKTKYYPFDNEKHLVDCRYMEVKTNSDALMKTMAKWHPLAKDRGYGSCGCCKRWKRPMISQLIRCNKCPIVIIENGIRSTCHDSVHPYQIWIRIVEKENECEDKIFNLALTAWEKL
jgi:hypothetical protein